LPSGCCTRQNPFYSGQRLCRDFTRGKGFAVCNTRQRPHDKEFPVCTSDQRQNKVRGALRSTFAMCQHTGKVFEKHKKNLCPAAGAHHTGPHHTGLGPPCVGRRPSTSRRRSHLRRWGVGPRWLTVWRGAVRADCRAHAWARRPLPEPSSRPRHRLPVRPATAAAR